MKELVKRFKDKYSYNFKNVNNLQIALTHPSNKKNQSNISYERMEFLGDAILDFVIADLIFNANNNFDEGTMTQLRSKIVSKKPLAEVVKKLGLDKYIISELNTKEKMSDKIYSNIYESLIAAVYIDSGDMNLVKRIVKETLADQITQALNNAIIDYKSQIYVSSTKNKFEVKCEYEESGPAHNRNFICKMQLIAKENCKMPTAIFDQIHQGSGKNKKDACQLAAKKTLEYIGKLK